MIRKIIMPILALTFALTSCADPSAGSGVPEFFRDVKIVSAGLYHTVAIKTDGTLWAWGNNSSGQLGDGTTFASSIPVQVSDPDPSKQWIAVSAGAGHTAAIKTDGTLWAWGGNTYGQLGNADSGYYDPPTNTKPKYSPIPVQVSDPDPSKQWIAVSASAGMHTIAIKKDGTLWAWGWNSYGKLGDGTTTTRDTPVQVSDPDPSKQWVAISAGSYHTAAIKANGTLWAWGIGGGQLGIGTGGDSYIPKQVGTAEQKTEGWKWQYVSAGLYHTVAIKTDGTIWAWGANSYGQLGDGTSGSANIPVQVKADAATPFTGVIAVSAGRHHTVAIKKDGTLWAWGDNEYYGQLGIGVSDDNPHPYPVFVGNMWKSVSAANDQTVAIKNDGVLWAWGYNENGQLGDATVKNKFSPVRVILSNW